jgi:4-hydroxymandelate oxidase
MAAANAAGGEALRDLVAAVANYSCSQHVLIVIGVDWSAMEPINIDDLESMARARLERSAYDYYAGAAGDERTLEANRRAFDRVMLRPRVLVDVSRVETAAIVLGERLSMPILLAPTAFNRLADPQGELAAARAAGDAGTAMIVSTISTFTIEEIAQAARGPLWFQLYVYKDREVTRELVARAEAAGYRALVLTVDTPRLGRRERDMRNGFTLPAGVTIRNLETCRAVVAGAVAWPADSSFSAYVHGLFDASLGWDAVEWLRSITRLPILLKGILTPEDARAAVSAGASGLIVSNHGGRQLDGVEPTIRALPGVVEAVAGGAEVLVDGGVRRGVHVLKALALGARAVLIGRAYLWGLAAEGEAGVRRALAMLQSELELAMALSGRPTIAAIDRSLVAIDGRNDR